MLKQIVIVLIIVFIAIIAYQISSNGGGGGIIPPKPLGPVVNPSFNFKNDGGYVIVKTPVVYGSKYSISFKIKTKNGSGIIFTSGGPVVRVPSVPYIVIYLDSTILRFIHNGPSGAAVLLSDPNQLTDDRWHDVQIHRDGASWTMFLDGKLSSSLSTASDDLLPSLTYIGNRPVKSELPDVDGIVGCIANIAINETINLTFVTTGGDVSTKC